MRQLLRVAKLAARSWARLKLSLHGSSWRVGCPWAWWWHVWHGWRTSLCPQRVQPSRPRMLLEVPSQLSSEIAGRSWSLERSHEQDAGRAASWWAIPWTFGIFWFLSEPLYRVCICEVSSHLQLLVHSCERPWLPAVYEVLFLQLIFLLFAWFVPWRYLVRGDCMIFANCSQRVNSNVQDLAPKCAFLSPHARTTTWTMDNGYEQCEWMVLRAHWILRELGLEHSKWILQVLCFCWPCSMPLLPITHSWKVEKLFSCIAACIHSDVTTVLGLDRYKLYFQERNVFHFTHGRAPCDIEGLNNLPMKINLMWKGQSNLVRLLWKQFRSSLLGISPRFESNRKVPKHGEPHLYMPAPFWIAYLCAPFKS